MANSLFFNHVRENETNKHIIQKFEEYVESNPDEQIYLITAPLGEQKYQYEYEENTLVILSPKHKIIFLDLIDDEDTFEEYYEDFMEDLSSLSDKFNYKQFIGRPRKWKDELTIQETYSQNLDIETLLKKNKCTDDLKRKNELLISLLIGSINNVKEIGVDTPESLLEKVKSNIILFDGDQTRFIYKKFENKTVSIQGLSGTGKTELLLHKLKELYTTDEDAKIFFTCHNIALANTLQERIPSFFNFMKVEKQIEWGKRLWVDRAWGSQRDKNSGLYSYLCHFYGIPFLRYSYITDYKKIFSLVLEHVNKLDEDEFEYALDYILIDERQDFPNVFFELCEKIARKKVYIAGDIFQDIFENTQETELKVDVILNRCYRTDPRTLMFAHAIGMGLFEDKKFNWLSDEYWEAIGYTIVRNDENICLSREPIRRFEELDTEETPSMIIQKYDDIDQIIEILKEIKTNNPTVEPDDIAIITLFDKIPYEYIDKLGHRILEELNWEINRGFDSRKKIKEQLFLSNQNHIKGLEFPFVVCITPKIKANIRYRNSLYTMLTRSFIQSYLLVKDDQGIDIQKHGLKIINRDQCIKTIEPTKKEKEDIKNTIIELQKEVHISYKDFLTKIFNDLRINTSCRKKLEKSLIDAEIEKFDKEATIDFIETNKRFFCK